VTFVVFHVRQLTPFYAPPVHSVRKFFSDKIRLRFAVVT